MGRTSTERLRRVAVLATMLAGLASVASACSEIPGEPPSIEVSGPQFGCVAIPTDTKQYFSVWQIGLRNKTPVEITNIHLVPEGKFSSAVKVDKYFAQGKNSLGVSGGIWLGLPQGIKGELGIKDFARATGLRSPAGTILQNNQEIRAAVVLEGEGPGIMNWKGMDITYRELSHATTRTVLDPISLQVTGGTDTPTGYHTSVNFCPVKETAS
jgi:hypothetical protein